MMRMKTKIDDFCSEVDYYINKPLTENGYRIHKATSATDSWYQGIMKVRNKLECQTVGSPVTLELAILW